ncbi:hypothetical protein HUJ05_011660 [Dendroctonus ponderosae]|nr:hypothetical protein HUJ05_011660 [Dendroctonus ponderosae]
MTSRYENKVNNVDFSEAKEALRSLLETECKSPNLQTAYLAIKQMRMLTGVSSTGSIFSLSFTQLNRPQSELKLGFRRPHWSRVAHVADIKMTSLSQLSQGGKHPAAVSSIFIFLLLALETLDISG